MKIAKTLLLLTGLSSLLVAANAEKIRGHFNPTNTVLTAGTRVTAEGEIFTISGTEFCGTKDKDPYNCLEIGEGRHLVTIYTPDVSEKKETWYISTANNKPVIKKQNGATVAIIND